MIGFWQRIVNGKQDKIAQRLYKILLAMQEGDYFHSKWLLSVKIVLFRVVINIHGIYKKIYH